MQLTFWLIIIPAVLWSLLYFRVTLLAGTAAMAGTFAVWSYLPGTSALAVVPVWAIFLAIAIPLNMTSLRRQLISDKALAAFRKVMPAMSQTERDALEAGTVWWDGELFSGKPEWRKLLDVPKPRLTEEEQAFIDGPVQQLCEMLDDWDITQNRNDLPDEVWQFLKDNGFFGMIIPKQYGGLEFSALAHSSVVMKIAGRSITAAVTVMVPNSLGPAELLMRYGTQEQKDHYLERLATGKEVPCFALTSPEAGSDAASMIDTGIVCRGEFNGDKDVLGIRLNWGKRYITLGPVATVLGLAFKLYDPDSLLGEKEDIGITCALIPTDTKGVEIGNRHFPLNSAFQNGPNFGKDVFIPLDWIIGGPDQVGKGWRMLMECLAAGRSISLPALATGSGKMLSRATGAYARVRKQFKTPIGKFEGVEEALAQIAGLTYMADATRTLTTSALDAGEHPSVISAIIKYNLTENMRTVVDDAMDIHGGSAICMGPTNLIGRLYQSVPISITVEGANILTRSLIIFGQGAIRCHPFVFSEMTAAANEDLKQASQDFDNALFKHIGFTMSNGARALWLGITGARFVQSPAQGPGSKYFKQLTRMSSAFALVTDVAMLILGGSLKRREKLSGRLADVLSHLYLCSATLKRFEETGRPAEDVPLMQWSCEHSLRTMQQSLDRFLINFPNKLVGKALRYLIFPRGKTYSGPVDALGHKAASLLLQPSTARDRLTEGVYLPDASPEEGRTATLDPIGRLEYAFECVIAAEDAEKVLRSAQKDKRITSRDRLQQIADALEQGLIEQKDVDLLNKADAATRDATSVDDFSQSELSRGQASGSNKSTMSYSTDISANNGAASSETKKDNTEPGADKECA